MSVVAIEVVVIIVTYKSAAMTIDCLRSIEAERSSPGLAVRAVVVDNASGDADTIGRAVAASGWQSWVTLVTSERNGGFAYGNNVGIRTACAHGSPGYLHLLNPDTVLRPGAIRALVDFLERHPAVGIAGGAFENLDGSEWKVAFRFPSLLGELEQGARIGVLSRLLRGHVVAMTMAGTPARRVDWVSGASMMVRRRVVEAIGGLDEGFFLYFEETEFCYRARQAGFSTWYVPASQVMHIAGQSTGVTNRDAGPKRLPAYWFESRRRYFTLTRGIAYAIAADLVALVAYSLGTCKCWLQRRPSVPRFVRDLAAHSPLRARHRPAGAIAPVVPRF